MKSILIATHNPAKVKEIKHGLTSLLKKKITFLTLKDLKIKKSPEETGKTFEDNALLKAKYYADKLNLPTIADDGGIAIKNLNGEPGVKSRMWLGYEVSDQKLIDHTLKKLKGVPNNKRQAYLETCVCFYDPNTKDAFFEKERINGYIALKQSKHSEKGYPFRSLFTLKINNKIKYYDSINSKEMKQINHRLIALQRLLPKIKSHLLK